MFVAKTKFPLNDQPEMKVHRFRDENESCAFGQKLTFRIMKANCEPELPEMLKLSFQQRWLLLSYIQTFRCTVPEIRNDFAVDLSRFETFFEALEHSPLGKKKHVVSCRKQCRQTWAGTRRGVCHFWVSLKAGNLLSVFVQEKLWFMQSLAFRYSDIRMSWWKSWVAQMF